MTIKTCKFRIGDVYLFHATDPGCESGTSLWGIVNDRDTDGRICLETSSADLKKYNHWTFLPAEYYNRANEMCTFYKRNVQKKRFFFTPN